MVSVVEEIVEKEWVSSDAPHMPFWIPAVGSSKSKLTTSLGKIVEHLIGERFNGDGTAKSMKLMFSRLRNWIRSARQRFLICIDHADDPELNEVINELLIHLAGEQHGWVLITSRQGKKWDGMSNEQLHHLKPLSNQDAMVALWRRKEGKIRSKVSDDAVKNHITKMKSEELEEFEALKLLSGNLGLGGLPLAIDQAGSFIRNRSMGYSEYLEMFKNEQKGGYSLPGIETPEQTIWTTWKLNVDELKSRTRQVLRGLALFEVSPIPESLAKRVFAELTGKDTCSKSLFSDAVMGELVNKSSLLELVSSKPNNRTYSMHPLIRHFIIRDSEQEHCKQQLCFKAFNSIYDCLRQILSNASHSFKFPPSSIGQDLLELIPHALIILRHSWNERTTYMKLSGQENNIPSTKKIENLH